MREMKPEQEDSREIKDELQLPEEEKPGFWGDSLADSGEAVCQDPDGCDQWK